MSLLSVAVATSNGSSTSGSSSIIGNESSSSSISTRTGGTAVYRHAGAEKRATMASNCPNNNPDLITQRAILEQLLGDKRLVEGEFWYVIVAEWLEQLKRYLGIQSTRKFYHQRAHPGPIITRRDYAHTVDVVHEDAWKMLVMWYGLAEDHKAMKLVVFRYSPSRAPELEHNLNTFKVMLCNAPPEEFHNTKFSKMDKVGHAEYKIREMYDIPNSQQTRLWGRPDPDSYWRPIFTRDKHIGKALEVDSDFTRPNVALEVCNPEGLWTNRPDPENTEQNLNHAAGPLYPNNIFEDVTTTWELDIHDQIEHIGKHFLEHLHTNFSAFIQRAKDYMDERDYRLRERERDVNNRDTFVDSLNRKLEEKEEQLNAEMIACERKIKEYESRRQDLEKEFAAKKNELEKSLQQRKDDLDRDVKSFHKEKETFNMELTRMSELYKIQDGRVKLDIGGHQFTTSLLTLVRDPNSMLAAMFSGRHELKVEPDGSYFIDRDGSHFRYILNFLRDGGIKEGTLPVNENVWRELLTEAEFFQLRDLVDYLNSLLYRKDVIVDGEETDTFV